MGIAFGSINSGLPKDIVQQIIAAEKIPVKQMETRKAKIENKKNLLGDLIKRVEDLRGAVYANKSNRSFREFSVNVGGNGFTATVDKNTAVPGLTKLKYCN